MKIQIELTVESEVWPVKVLGVVDVCPAPRSGPALLAFLIIVVLIVSGCQSPLLTAPASELDWQWRNPLPGNSDLNAVVFAQERFVAVGDTGTILVSRDGETWERPESPTSVPLYGIAYRYGSFVAVGGEWAKGYSVSLVSTDGLFSWRLSKVGDGNQLRGVAYGNGLFVAVGNSWTGDLGVVYTSVDGITWTLRKTGVPTLRDVMFDGDRFIAVGENGTFLCSANGIDWIETVAPIEVDSVAYGAGRYLGVSGVSITEPLAFSSVDLQSWTPCPLPKDAGCLRAVTYGGGHFVSVGYSGTVLTSVDGLSWVQQPNGIESTLNDVAYGSGSFVAVGGEGAIISSPDSSKALDSSFWPWTLQVAGTRLFLRGVTYGNGAFVALGSRGRIVTSPDGVSWTSAEENETLSPWSFTGVEYGNGVFVATAMYYGFTPGIFTSKDGVDWELASPYPGPTYGPMARGFSAVTFGNGRFVVAQQYGVTMTSVDGVKWTWDQSQPRRSFTDVAWGNGQFVAAVQHGNRAVVLISVDGMTWTESSASGAASPCAVAYGNGQYVAAYPDGAVYSSSDCVNWIERRLADGNELRRIAFGGGLFVAVGDRGTILTSRDGITWILNPSFTVRQLEDVLYAHGRFVIVGETGTILSAGLPDSYGL